MTLRGVLSGSRLLEPERSRVAGWSRGFGVLVFNRAKTFSGLNGMIPTASNAFLIVFFRKGRPMGLVVESQKVDFVNVEDPSSAFS